MGAQASNLSALRGALNMMTAGWLPFTTLHVPPVDLKGRNALVTGANIGIGYEIALKLARFGANVWLLCRDPAKAEAARTRLVEQSGNENIAVAVVDLRSFASVKHFTDEWISSHRLVDILVNNAGGHSGTYQKTSDGHEATYQTNFLSHALLVLSLLPYFAERGRIVNVSSHGQYAAKKATLEPTVDLDKLLLESKSGIHDGDELPYAWFMGLYERSKALQLIFGRQLQQRLSSSDAYASKNIVVHSCHPGMVKSNIYDRPLPPSTANTWALVRRVVFILGVDCEQGACTPVYLATAPETAIHGGEYWDRMTRRTPNALVFDDALGDALWDSWLSAKGFEGLSKGLEKRE